MSPPYGKILDESFEAYHSNGALGSGSLATINQNARLFQMRLTNPRKDTAALGIGRAAHCLILEGPDEYARRYAIGGPINPKTNRQYGADTQAYAAWAATQGKPCVSSEDDRLVHALYDAVRANPEAMEALDGEHEVTYRTQLPEADVQCRCDSIDEGRGIIADVKTTENLEKFRKSWYSLNYHLSAAHYIDTVQAVTGIACRFLFVAVEKNPPYSVAVFELDEGTLDQGRADRERALQTYARCSAENSWPRDPEGVQILSLPAWARKDDGVVVSAREDW